MLALWEFDGWPAPTAERPLGLRFMLLEDGRVRYAPDDPAMDRLISSQYFQARLSPEETLGLTMALQAFSNHREGRSWGAAAFYTSAIRQLVERKTEFGAHPCLARGRVFSATVPVAGMKAAHNSAARAPGTEPWSPQSVPALLPER